MKISGIVFRHIGRIKKYKYEKTIDSNDRGCFTLCLRAFFGVNNRYSGYYFFITKQRFNINNN